MRSIYKKISKIILVILGTVLYFFLIRLFMNLFSPFTIQIDNYIIMGCFFGYIIIILPILLIITEKFFN